jgi:hypothetical protein
MVAEENDPNKVYMLSPDHMEESIRWYLVPVKDRLRAIAGTYQAAHDQAKAAHDEETPGWFGGEGHGHVRPATSSFLNEVSYQLMELASDQDRLATSLQAYHDMLMAHIKEARDRDQAHADNFTAIHRELESGGR